MIKGEACFKAPANFNDPFDCNYQENVIEEFKDIGVLCFGEDADNILLWAHYADEHKGICIGISPSEVKFIVNDSGQYSTDWRPVSYYEKLPPFDLNEKRAYIGTCKNRIWAYEKEYRVFALSDKVDASGKAILAKPGSYKIPTSSIKEIIFGCRMGVAEIDAIRDVIRGLNIKCCRARKVPGSFTLKIDKCDAR